MTTEQESDNTHQSIQQCVEAALLCISNGKLVEAQQELLNGLSRDPFNPRARILLARVFFELKQLPFAIRELEQVYRELPGNKYVKSLLERLAPERVTLLEGENQGVTTSSSEEKTLAEVDFDIDDIEILEK